VDLILGSFTRTSSTISLLKLKLPPSLPVAPHPEESLYHPKPPIYHTFREEQRMPPKVLSLLFVAITLSPWGVLFLLVCRCRRFAKNIQYLTLYLHSPILIALPLTVPSQAVNGHSSFHCSPPCLRDIDRLVLGRLTHRTSPHLWGHSGTRYSRCRKESAQVLINRSGHIAIRGYCLSMTI